MTKQAPIAKRVPRTDRRHGREFDDPYFWLRERDDPEVIGYLEAENAYTEAMMQPTGALQARLYEEMLARIKQSDESVPTPHGGYFYYRRTEEGKQYRFHCRKKGSLDAEEQMLLDGNALAEGQEFFKLGVLAVSPDHNILAYSVDTAGDETYTMYFKDLRTGELLEDQIPGAFTSLEWAADNRTVFYNTIDAAHRPYRVLRHELGTDPGNDPVLYEETDEAFHLGLYKSKDERYILLSVDSNNTTEMRSLDARAPAGEFRLIQERVHQVEYQVEHWNDRFYILTNDGAVNFKMVEAPVDAPGRASWKDVIPHRPEVKLDGFDVFARHLVVIERREGLRELHIREFEGGGSHMVEFPEPAYAIGIGPNPEFESTRLRFRYESPVTAPTVFDYDMVTRERELKKQDEVLGGYDPENYVTERVFAEAGDGTRIPITIVHRKELDSDTPAPCLLYGYGSYGVTLDPSFSSVLLTLIDRGMIYAIAHIRGGGDMGRPWYDAGKLLHKRTTFSDFISCAEHLIAEGRTAPDRLAIRGGSAGGLLMGAVINMRPDLFHLAVARVPFVDVVNTMLDGSLPLTAIEREEWGDPREEPYHDYMLSYSPYDNVEVRSYPHMLVTTGINDPRVQYWEPAKWVARLRAMRQDDNLLLLKTDMDSGHGGPSGRYDSLRELAFEFAFVLTLLGLEKTG